uniref:Uncharacterized protein n=1 Tax=Anguilla anguilla TaxID=7936 RepID=A0A0E9PG70_ANGAN
MECYSWFGNGHQHCAVLAPCPQEQSTWSLWNCGTLPQIRGSS